MLFRGSVFLCIASLVSAESPATAFVDTPTSFEAFADSFLASDDVDFSEFSRVVDVASVSNAIEAHFAPVLYHNNLLTTHNSARVSQRPLIYSSIQQIEEHLQNGDKNEAVNVCESILPVVEATTEEVTARLAHALVTAPYNSMATIELDEMASFCRKARACIKETIEQCGGNLRTGSVDDSMIREFLEANARDRRNMPGYEVELMTRLSAETAEATAALSAAVSADELTAAKSEIDRVVAGLKDSAEACQSVVEKTHLSGDMKSSSIASGRYQLAVILQDVLSGM